MFHDQNRSSGNSNGGTPVRTGTYDARSISERLADRIVGQPSAIRAVRRALVVAQAGVQDHERPLANLLLVGPTGVGKTELVRQLAAALRSGPDDLCRVDMSQLAQEHYAASFSGSPPGYAGSKENFSLFDRGTVEGGPYTPGIVLFDEVEKADPAVLRALLGILDCGTLRLANGEQAISFRNAFVFMTSNLGTRELDERRRAPWRRLANAVADIRGAGGIYRRTGHLRTRSDSNTVDRAVRSFFDPEFLNRIDEVVHFDEISTDVATRITELEIHDVVQRLRRRGLDVVVDAAAVETLRRAGFDPAHGARSLRRTINRHVLVPAAEALVAQREAQIANPRVRIETDGHRIAVRPAFDEPASATSPDTPGSEAGNSGAP
jgi:ATP-dependent Clp protease ATP-binding subunit ClpA